MSSIWRWLAFAACMWFSGQVAADELVALYPKERLFTDVGFHPNVMIEAYHPKVYSDPDSSLVACEFTIQFQKGADGKIELAYIEEIVPYQTGEVHIGLILDGSRRLHKAVVLQATQNLIDIFQGVTKHGLMARYTATSVRQLKYLYNIQKEREPEAAFLAREVWILGTILAGEIGL